MHTYRLGLMILTFAFVSPLFAENNPGKKTETVVAPFVQKVMRAGEVIDVIQTRDGNYVSLTKPSQAQSYIVRKATASGKRIWERFLHVETLYDGYAFLNAIAETNDGYVLVGYGRLESFYYGTTVGIVITLHGDGTLNRSQKFEVNGTLEFHSVGATPDGGFTVMGGIYPGNFHAVVLRFTSTGSILWAKQFETLTERFSSQSVSDSGLVLIGDIFGSDGIRTGVTLVKVDSSGQINWSKNLTLHNSAFSVGATLNKGIIIATHPDNSRNLSLIRLDEHGRIKWRANYDIGATQFSITNLSQTRDAGYVITGTSRNFNGFFLKIGPRLNVALQKTFGLKGTFEGARSMFATEEGGYVLFGEAENDMLFLNLNSQGLVPGCNFVRHLPAKKVQTRTALLSTTTITSQNVSLPAPTSLKVRTGISRKESSVTCH